MQVVKSYARFPVFPFYQVILCCLIAQPAPCLHVGQCWQEHDRIQAGHGWVWFGTADSQRKKAWPITGFDTSGFLLLPD